jgi:hypothetical protein
MKQTLLSLLAMLVAMFLSFNQMQASLQSQEQTVRAEMQMMALGVAMQTMEVVRARAFDAATKDVESNYLDPKEDDFSTKSEGDFGRSGNCTLYTNEDGETYPKSSVDCKAIEEFHKKEGVVPFLLEKESLDFNVSIGVYYVCANFKRVKDGSCSAPTRRKEVVVKVRDTKPHRLSQPITYSEVITYP